MKITYLDRKEVEKYVPIFGGGLKPMTMDCNGTLIDRYERAIIYDDKKGHAIKVFYTLFDRTIDTFTMSLIQEAEDNKWNKSLLFLKSLSLKADNQGIYGQEMRLVPGQTLATKNPLPLAELSILSEPGIRLGEQIRDISAQGIVLSDTSPENIMYIPYSAAKGEIKPGFLLLDYYDADWQSNKNPSTILRKNLSMINLSYLKGIENMAPEVFLSIQKDYSRLEAAMKTGEEGPEKHSILVSKYAAKQIYVKL